MDYMKEHNPVRTKDFWSVVLVSIRRLVPQMLEQALQVALVDLREQRVGEGQGDAASP
jgi:hypothetical protein